MKPREMSMGENHAILKLRKRKIHQRYPKIIACSQKDNSECPEKEATGVLSYRHQLQYFGRVLYVIL